MSNPNFRAVWVPLKLHARLERVQWRMMALFIEKGEKPNTPMPRLVELALEESKIEERLGIGQPVSGRVRSELEPGSSALAETR